jgi:hypothetical protein
MRHNLRFLLTAVVLVIPAGCSDRPAQEQQQGKRKSPNERPQVNEFAPDIRDGWRWSAAEVAALNKKAEAGDMGAANRLLQYYSVHEDSAKIAYWEDWLLKRGDPDAIELRANKLYSDAQGRPDNDPQKLALLKEAERLWLSVRHGDKRGDDYFLSKLRSEITSVEQ